MARRRFQGVPLALAGIAATLAACGGGRAAPLALPPSGSASGSANAAPAPPAADASPTRALAPSPIDASVAQVAPTPAPTSTVASLKTEDSWAPCHRRYKATARDVAKDVAALARGCEAQTKMKLVGKTLLGKQADQDKPQSFPLEARADHCYRVYAQAAEGIKDLDLAVIDSAGVVVGQDSTDDSSPVVLEDGAVCFRKDDRATVVVSVGMGSGAYAVQIWGD